MQLPSVKTLPRLLDALAMSRPDAPALSDPRRTVTFATFRQEAIAFARALRADGVRPGDKVGVLMGNCIEWLVACFGIQYAGATMVALNTWYTQRELAYVLSHGDVSVLVTADRFLKSDYVELLGGLDLPQSDAFPLMRRVVVLGQAGSQPGWINWDDFVAQGLSITEATIARTADAVAAQDIAYILYTSGSTSRPKGVMLEHGRMIENGLPVGDRLHFAGDDVLFLPVSLFWGLGCENAVPAAWTRGMHIVLQPSFEVTEALDLIERHRCSAIYSTANVVFMLFDHPEAATRDLSALRKGMAGGSRRVIEQYLPLGCRAYGLTESYGYATLTDAGDPIEARVDSFGRPLPGITLKILSLETGGPAAAGETGEVRLRGNVTPGYYKSPEQTAEAFDEDGFFKTGDLGYTDQNGFFYFKGRIKEMLKTGGMNVSPAEVEDVLRLHPQVADAFVTGLPDPLREQVVAAVLLPKAGETIDEAAVVAHCRAQLAAFKVPRRFKVVDHAQLPFTTTGKVHKQRLPELFAA